MYDFVIEHKIVPYTRTTQAMKFVDPRYHKYRYSQDDLRRYFANAMAVNDWPILERKPIQVAIVIHLTKVNHKTDLDNQVKAVIDAAQGVVFPWDGWIDGLYASRRKARRDRVILFVSPEPVPGFVARMADELDRASLVMLDNLAG